MDIPPHSSLVYLSIFLSFLIKIPANTTCCQLEKEGDVNCVNGTDTWGTQCDTHCTQATVQTVESREIERDGEKERDGRPLNTPHWKICGEIKHKLILQAQHVQNKLNISFNPFIPVLTENLNKIQEYHVE